MGIWIGCDSCKRHVHCKIIEEVEKYTIPVFIKAVVIHHGCLLWFIKRKIYILMLTEHVFIGIYMGLVIIQQYVSACMAVF